jgi:hypothetical protein
LQKVKHFLYLGLNEVTSDATLSFVVDSNSDEAAAVFGDSVARNNGRA